MYDQGYPQQGGGYPQQGYPQQQQGPQQTQDAKLYTSSLVKNAVNFGVKDQNGKPQTTKLQFPQAGTNFSEEISFTFSREKLQDLLNRIHMAMQHPDGSGGVRISLACNHYPPKGRGRPYDGATVRVSHTRIPQQAGGGRFNNGGGRSYPQQGGYPQQGYPQQAPQQAYPPTMGMAPQQPQLPPNQYVQPPVQQGMNPAPAPVGVPNGGVAGPGPTAQTTASPSDEGGYDEDRIPF